MEATRLRERKAPGCPWVAGVQGYTARGCREGPSNRSSHRGNASAPKARSPARPPGSPARHPEAGDRAWPRARCAGGNAKEGASSACRTIDPDAGWPALRLRRTDFRAKAGAVRDDGHFPRVCVDLYRSHGRAPLTRARTSASCSHPTPTTRAGCRRATVEQSSPAGTPGTEVPFLPRGRASPPGWNPRAQGQ